MIGGVRTSHLLIFSRQFAAMVRSNLPLVLVLRNLYLETPQPQLKIILKDVLEQVEQGVDLADALSRHPRVFSDVYINVVRSGMNAGNLGDALIQVSVYIESINELNRRFQKAASYPAFMFLSFFVVFNIMVLLILPKFESMFSNFGAKLPWATSFMLAVGDFWMNYWIFVLLSFFVAIGGFIIWIRTEEGRAIWDQYKLQIPMLGSLWRMGSLARFLRTFAVQAHNGVPILHALFLSASAGGNIYIEAILKDIGNEIKQGIGISDSFSKHKVFSGIVMQMISSGEEAGELGELLVSSADYFDSLTKDRLETLTGLLNPVLTVFIGLGIAGMLVAAFLPVFQISGAVSGGM